MVKYLCHSKLKGSWKATHNDREVMEEEAWGDYEVTSQHVSSQRKEKNKWCLSNHFLFMTSETPAYRMVLPQITQLETSSWTFPEICLSKHMELTEQARVFWYGPWKMKTRQGISPRLKLWQVYASNQTFITLSEIKHNGLFQEEYNGSGQDTITSPSCTGYTSALCSHNAPRSLVPVPWSIRQSQDWCFPWSPWAECFTGHY